MTERMKKADAFQKQNFNCAQSVLAAFGDLTGLDDETAKKIAGGLGGGMGGCRSEVCGALSGAIFYAPIKIPQPPTFPYRLQYSIIGRLSLNHRVRDVDGCFP